MAGRTTRLHDGRNIFDVCDGGLSRGSSRDSAFRAGAKWQYGCTKKQEHNQSSFHGELNFK
jgi:hypothetical protein